MQSSKSPDLASPQITYGPKELPLILDPILDQYPNCQILIKTEGTRKVRQRVIIFQEGKVAFCGDRVPSLEDFVALIHYKVKSDWVERTFESSQDNELTQMTPFAFCERLLKLRILQRTDLVKILLASYILSTEPLWMAGGSIEIIVNQDCAPYYCVEWRMLKLALEKRQSAWEKLEPLTFGINSIPTITETGISALVQPFDAESKEAKLVESIQKFIDGRSDFVDLARRTQSDPLALSQELNQAFEWGWLTINSEVGAPTDKTTVSNVLVIDEQGLMKRLLVTLLQSKYKIYETSSTIEALSLIPQRNINLVLIAQSIPFNSGLQLSRVIRQNPQYSELPIVCLVTRDHLIDRVKARLNGINEYIAQPFNRSELIAAMVRHLN